MRIRLSLIALVCCLTGSAVASDHGDEFTLYLVRHAEKQADGSRDPNLTEAGEQRAKFLAAWLKNKQIGDIYSSGYQRTIGTARPTGSSPRTSRTSNADAMRPNGADTWMPCTASHGRQPS